MNSAVRKAPMRTVEAHTPMMSRDCGAEHNQGGRAGRGRGRLPVSGRRARRRRTARVEEMSRGRRLPAPGGAPGNGGLRWVAISCRPYVQSTVSRPMVLEVVKEHRPVRFEAMRLEKAQRKPRPTSVAGFSPPRDQPFGNAAPRPVFRDDGSGGTFGGPRRRGRMQMRWPLLPVILTSGHPRECVGELPPGVGYMPKPWQALTC